MDASGRGAAWLACLLWEQEVGGSNPPAPTTSSAVSASEMSQAQPSLTIWHGDADGAASKNQSRNSPGAGYQETNGTTTVGHAERPTRKSTTQRTESGTSRTPRPGNAGSSMSACDFSSGISGTIRVSIAAKRTSWSWSSTTWGRRALASRRASATAIGTPSWPKWRNATWSAPTAIGDGLPSEEVSSAADCSGFLGE